MAGLTGLACATSTVAVPCGTDTCAIPEYSGTPVATCANGEFSFSGCELSCANFNDDPYDAWPEMNDLGYSSATPTANTVSGLGTISCFTGYTETVEGTAPTATCDTAGGSFTLSGCTRHTVKLSAASWTVPPGGMLIALAAAV